MRSNIVSGEGAVPCRNMVVGERPGEQEYYGGRPFIGPTGKEQDAHLSRGGLSRRDFYFDNLCPDYLPGNPSPTPGEIMNWGPRLLSTISRVRPSFIIAAGFHSTRFFLGDSAYLEAVHGVPHWWRHPESGHKSVVIPTYHPAAHFHQPDLLPFIVYDYSRACACIKGQLPVDPPSDRYPEPQYFDGGARELDEWLPRDVEAIATDSEGVPRRGAEWSFQASAAPGTGVVCRTDHPEFAQALDTFRRRIRGKILVGHSLMYEIEMFASMGLDLLDPDLNLAFFDTMMAAYLLCIEPQSLKNLARRHCGMVMKEYMEVVGEAGKKKQLDYLINVMSGSWPKPEARVEQENDGTTRLYTPQPVQRRGEAILLDVYSEKVDKEGKLTDPLKRWRKVDRELRRMVEAELGPMPIGTLADVPLDKAIHYAGRDPDATLRLYPKMKSALEVAGLTPLMDIKMAMLPAVAAMKMNGLLGEKEAFVKLGEEMWDQMGVIRDKISSKFLDGRPFNPMSGDQVALLMRKRGLVGAKRTPKGKVSTSKKSIEHLRFEDPAIELVEQWREASKVKDSFSDPVLDNWPDDPSITRARVRCDIKITRVTSGRFSASLLDDVPSAPLMAIPVRTGLGKRVRDCYVAEEGWELGEWDLDQAEMRVMADESGDERLIRLFNEGKVDVHGDTASKIFHVPYEDTMHGEGKMKYRYPAKRAGFGIITRIQGAGLFDQLRMAGCKGWSVKLCDRLIDDWMELNPGVPKYMKWCGDECRENGGVIKDRWGMPRHLPNVFSDDKYERLEAERQAHSHRIQGGAQGSLQKSMAWAWKELARYREIVRFILQIHDSLIMESMKGMREIVGGVMVEAMTKHGAQLKVPILCSQNFAASWGQLKD